MVNLEFLEFYDKTLKIKPSKPNKKLLCSEGRHRTKVLNNRSED